MTVELPPGSYDVIATSPGFRPSTRRLTVTAGESQKLALVLGLEMCPPGECREVTRPQVIEPIPVPLPDSPISSDPSLPSVSAQHKYPQDKPIASSAEQLKKFEDAIAPYVKQARETLPEAKKRYVVGLPKNQIFYVTIKLFGDSAKYEQVFVRVTSWKGETIQGTLDSELELIHNYSKGDQLTCHDSEVLDWTISKPDGTEEGNFVGKFLDTYRP